MLDMMFCSVLFSCRDKNEELVLIRRSIRALQRQHTNVSPPVPATLSILSIFVSSLVFIDGICVFHPQESYSKATRINQGILEGRARRRRETHRWCCIWLDATFQEVFFFPKKKKKKRSTSHFVVANSLWVLERKENGMVLVLWK